MATGYQYRNYDSSDTTSVGRELYIVDIASIGWVAPEGKVFVEWNTARDGTGTTYHNSDLVSPTISVYAIWATDENYVTTTSEITSIADAIRAKGATSALLLYPNGFVSAINAIQTGSNISDTTAVAGDVLSGKYFYTASGAKTQGTITTKTASNLSASGKTVTVPAGYYASQYTKDVATGSATTPATTITSNPTISVNSSTGVITASNSKTQNVTPTVSAGYVSSGTAGTITVNGSNTSQLTVQAAQTITPTTTDQTIASGKYLTGTQTIKGDANLIAGNIKNGITLFGVTGSYAGAGGRVTQDAQGNVTLSDTGSIVAETPLSVTQNGTYTPNSGYAYSEVEVNVSGGGESIKTISGGGCFTVTSAAGWTVDDFDSKADTGAFGWIDFLSEKRRVSICDVSQRQDTGSFQAVVSDTSNLITFSFKFVTSSEMSTDIVSIVLTRIELNMEDITSEYSSEVGNWQLFSFAYPSYS